MSRKKNRKWEKDVAKRVRQMQARHGKANPSKAESKAKFDREHWQNVAAGVYGDFAKELGEFMVQKRSIDEISQKYDELKKRLRRRVKHKETLQISYAKINAAVAEMRAFALIPKKADKPENN